jgi:hypothetical protein
VWWARHGPFPARGFSHRAAANAPQAGRIFKKMLKIEGTNSTSPLESTKVQKNELKTNSKRTGNELEKRAENAQKRPKRTQKLAL